MQEEERLHCDMHAHMVQEREVRGRDLCTESLSLSFSKEGARVPASDDSNEDHIHTHTHAHTHGDTLSEDSQRIDGKGREGKREEKERGKRTAQMERTMKEHTNPPADC